MSSRSASGGAGNAAGGRHQDEVFACLACCLLADRPLPEFAGGFRLVAVGVHSHLEVDDIGALTEDNGWVAIQSKITLGLDSKFDKALDQVVRLGLIGLPVRQGASVRRPVDPQRDRVLIVSNRGATQEFKDLSAVLKRLGDTTSVPGETPWKTKNQQKAYVKFRGLFDAVWLRHHGTEPSDSDVRDTCAWFGVTALALADTQEHRIDAEAALRDVLPASAVSTIWRGLVAIGGELSQAFLDRDRLVQRLKPVLEEAGVSLEPVPRLRPQIRQLRTATDRNMTRLEERRSIWTPGGRVVVRRTVIDTVTQASGHVVVTGPSGTGKSAVLHEWACDLRDRGSEVVVLRADELRFERGRVVLPGVPAYDLAEVLAGWYDDFGEATVLIDGIDQVLGQPVAAALRDLTGRLDGTRWRLVIGVRDDALRRDRQLCDVFSGTPVDAAHADPTLSDVRHVVPGAFDAHELAQITARHPALATLVAAADDRLRSLLTNPLNLDLVAQLHATNDVELSALHRRVDILHQYWRARARVEDGTRSATLAAIAQGMIDMRRQVVSTTRLTGIDSAVVRSLCSDGVLRELPMLLGDDGPRIEFAHPALFDYAVAVHVLGDPSDPNSLVATLDGNRDLAIMVEPSVQLRLAVLWRRDPSRAAFWGLGIRLSRHAGGHPLVAAQLAQVAIEEIQSDTDCSFLASVCADPWNGSGASVEDARDLARLVARAASHGSKARAVRAVAALTRTVASRAREMSDPDTALFAAELARRTVAGTDSELHSYWLSVAADCAEFAAAFPSDPSSHVTVQHIGHLLAHLIMDNGAPACDVITTLTRPDGLRGWGTQHLRPLIPHLAVLARVDADLAATIATSAWQDPDARSALSWAFPGFLQAAPAHATALWLAVLETPEMYPFSSSVRFDNPPHLRFGASLQFPPGTHTEVLAMTNAWVSWLHASARASTKNLDLRPVLTAVVETVVTNLQHADTWELLLHQANVSGGTELARLLLPALTSPNLYVMHTTWGAAAHLARRLSPLLSPDEHAALERAILHLDRAGHHTAPDDEHVADLRLRGGMILGALDRDRLQSDHARLRSADATPLPDLTDPATRHTVTPIASAHPGGTVARPAPGHATAAPSTPSTEHALSTACTMLRDPAYDPAVPIDTNLQHALRAGHASPGNHAAQSGLGALLAPYLDSPDPGHRQTVTGVLPLLLPSEVDLVDEVAQRLGSESDPRVAAILLHMLWSQVSTQPDKIDTVMADLLDHKSRFGADPVADRTVPDRYVTGAACRILTILATAHRSPFASSRVTTWFADPEHHADYAHHAIVTLREILNTPNVALRAARAAAFDLINSGANACLTTWLATASDNTARQRHAFQHTASAQVAAEISASLFMCSGALDHIDPRTAPARGHPTRFAHDALLVLHTLAHLSHPSVTRDVVQTCLVLAPHRPSDSINIIARIFTSNDPTYLTETLALDTILDAVDRYMIPDSNTPNRRQHLIDLQHVLDVFILTGRGDAVALVRKIEDAFD